MEQQNNATNNLYLVTGSTGLVGNELITQLLAKGYKVRALINNTPIDIQHGNLTTFQCDILDTTRLEEAMKGVTHVYHCAGMVSFNPKTRAQLFKVNVEGTANVVNAAMDADVQKFVHVSSVAALGRIREGEKITEKMNWSEETSNSVYGKSKYLGEMEVWRAMGEGLPCVIVNPSMILGAGDWEKGSSGIFKSAYNEFPWYAEGVSGFVDVRDVAEMMIILMDSRIANERFILSSENVSFKDLFTSIAKCFNKKPPHKRVTPFLGGLIWRLEALKSFFTGKDPLVTKETARTALAKVYFDTTKISITAPAFKFKPVNETLSFVCATLQQKYDLAK